MDWINVARARDKWRVVVDMVMDFQVPKNTGNLLSSWGTVSV
jgi:hypothetical protein